MSQNATTPIDAELQRLEARVGELLNLVRQLSEENRALRHRQDHLAGERATLLQRNEQARAGVEAMIGRLRMLESGCMTTGLDEPVNIRILEKDYLIACPAEEREDLTRAATLLEARLRKAREGARGMGTERWLMMAALNMANELAKLQAREELRSREMGTGVRQMRERVERALVQGQQLEL